jgi:hypothetical protein
MTLLLDIRNAGRYDRDAISTCGSNRLFQHLFCPASFMSKIYSAQLHGNENAGIEFNVVILKALQVVRDQMAELATSRKADEYAPGAIHALRKLCEGEKEPGIHRLEVEEWEATFFAWFERVKKHFPAGLRNKFLANAKADFLALLKCADEMPEYFWREDIEKRHVQIEFKDEAALEAARDAAEKKHPVDLGSALQKYLESCIAKLVGKKSSTKKATSESPPVADPALALRFTFDGKRSELTIDDFSCFNRPDDVAQDIVVSAYDVEDALKKYLKARSPQTLKALRFGSESSLFVVSSADPAALVAVVAALHELAREAQNG